MGKKKEITNINKETSFNNKDKLDRSHHKFLITFLSLIVLFIGGTFTSRLPSTILEYITPSLALVNTILLLVIIAMLVSKE